MQTLPEQLEDPLSAAIAERDSKTLEMVQVALDRKNVMLAYQPVMQVQGGQVAFYEGLIRVLDDTGRIIPAREFIGVAETTELGRIIDCLALEQALTALAETPDLRLAVNLSARSIGYRRWTETLERGLTEHPTVGERLILEITESSAILMPDIVTAFMKDLHLKGIAFALDDFGAGYTAFRYLRDFYFDIIKIDGQFIRGIASSPDNQVLARALVSIATHFEMFTVAESVENEDDATFLAQIGIDCLQGYLYGAPSISPPFHARSQRRLA